MQCQILALNKVVTRNVMVIIFMCLFPLICHKSPQITVQRFLNLMAG
jgi:hypothetical protein